MIAPEMTIIRPIAAMGFHMKDSQLDVYLDAHCGSCGAAEVIAEEAADWFPAGIPTQPPKHPQGSLDPCSP